MALLETTDSNELIHINAVVLPGGKRVSRPTLYRWANKGIAKNGNVPLRLYKVGGATFVRRSELDRFIALCNGQADADTRAHSTRSPAQQDAAASVAMSRLAAMGVRGVVPGDTGRAGRNPRRGVG